MDLDFVAYIYMHVLGAFGSGLCGIYIYVYVCMCVDDHSRVALSLQDNTPGSDYINASFIDVRTFGMTLYHVHKIYIVCSSPCTRPQSSDCYLQRRLNFCFSCVSYFYVSILACEFSTACYDVTPCYIPGVSVNISSSACYDVILWTWLVVVM